MRKGIFIFFFLLPLWGMAQMRTDSSVSATINSKLEKYSSSHQTEKVYLHFDKPYYAAGDTMFFKAYLTLGNHRRLSALSGVLYVELIDSFAGNIIKSEKLPVLNGVAWGDFALPDSLQNGNYRVRAYTRLMLNDTQSLFEQNIPVVAVTKPQKSSPVLQTSTTNLRPDIQFFPEGGSLVNEINTKIAFKAIAPNGLGIAAAGKVVDNENKIVATFKTTHLGMGCFYLKPEAGKTYQAKVSYANGTQGMVDLPNADESGITLSLNNNYSALVATVAITGNDKYFRIHKGQGYALSIYSNGELTNIKFRLDSQSIMVNLFKWRMHSGVTRLTLFSPEGQPLCERLMFIRNNDELKLNLSSDKPDYETRGKVNIKLFAVDNKDKPVNGNFSVSVTNENAVPVDSDSEYTILNNLLLISELKGNIEQPNYYFGATEAAYNDLDVLLLTQGYRGFSWKAVLTDTTKTTKYDREISLSINGIVKTPGGKPAPKDSVNLLSTKPYITRDTLTDNNGNFTFNDINVIDTIKLVLRARGNRVIHILQPDPPAITKTFYGYTTNSKITPALTAEIIKRYQVQGGNMKKGMVLKQVNVHAARGEHPFAPKLAHSDNLNGPGEADQTVLMDDYIGYPTLESVLTMAVHVHRPALGNQPPVVILGGVAIPINDPSNPLKNIPVSDIYSIEMLYSPAYLAVYGSKATGGAIVVTLRSGTEKGSISMQPGLTTYNFTGFYRARKFYSPKYEVKTVAGNIPDYRTTIYWKPLLLTDKDGNASFDFYNADAPGNYRVVIEGIDGSGNLGRQVYHYRVK